MNKNNQIALSFPEIEGKKIRVDFLGGEVTNDAGVLLLREVENEIGIISQIGNCINDKRHQSYIDHSYEKMITQRVFQISCGYEDANDCDRLRNDPGFKMSCETLPLSGCALASQPTMTRLENNVSQTTLYRIGSAFVDNFIASYSKPPRRIILDIDDTDDPTHGAQQCSLFNSYYDEYCYQPFHIYEGNSGKLILTVLRPGKRPTGAETVSIIRRVVEKIRAKWPRVIITIRGDSHFSSPEMFDLCKTMQLRYTLGLTGNKRLLAIVHEDVDILKRCYEVLEDDIKHFLELQYKADSWKASQRVICKIEVNGYGTNIRFIVTSKKCGKARRIYDKDYCGRGRMENFIKNHKTFLHSDRTSCHSFQANQFRLFLHGAAYVLMHKLLERTLSPGDMIKNQFNTVQQKVLKIAARIVEYATIIKVHLPSSLKWREVFENTYYNLLCFRS